MTANGGRRSPASRACHSASLRLVTASRSTGGTTRGSCCRAEESKSLVAACVGTLVVNPDVGMPPGASAAEQCELVARAFVSRADDLSGLAINPNRRPGPGAANCTQTLPRVLSVAPGRKGIPSRDHAQRCAFLHRTTPRGKRPPSAHSIVARARPVARSPTSGHPAGTGSGYSMSKAIGSSRRRTPAARPEQARAGPALGTLPSGRKPAQGRDAVSSPAPWMPVGPAPCFWRNVRRTSSTVPRLHACRRVYANQARSPWLPMSGGSSMVAISRASRRPFSGRRSGSQDFAGRNEKRLVLIALIHDGAQLSL